MGQQQLLLIVLGVIIVGVAITIGINFFDEYSINQKRELLIAECVNLASMAQKYYLTPKEYGGGGKDFSKWQMNSKLEKSINGDFEFSAEPAEDQVVINAKGNIDAVEGTKVEVEITVFASDYQVKIIH